MPPIAWRTSSGARKPACGPVWPNGVINVSTSAPFAAWSDSHPRSSAARWPGANDSSTTSARRARSRSVARSSDVARSSTALRHPAAYAHQPRPASPGSTPSASGAATAQGMAAGGLDLEHVGAEVGEDLAAERAERAREVHHAQVGEGAAAHRRARRAVSARSRAGSPGRSRPRLPARARGRAAPTPIARDEHARRERGAPARQLGVVHEQVDAPVLDAEPDAIAVLAPGRAARPARTRARRGGPPCRRRCRSSGRRRCAPCPSRPRARAWPGWAGSPPPASRTRAGRRSAGRGSPRGARRARDRRRAAPGLPAT